MAREVVIVGAARTPIGSFQGALSKLTAPQLGAIAIKAALERAGVKPEAVQEVIMGCVLQAGVGQAPARQATIFAGLPDTVPAVTLNKVCGSGLKAVIAAAQSIALGDADVVVAGGMESMSNAPYISHTMRGGSRMGNVEFKDAMISDGLWDVYGNVHMGNCAEECSTSQGISRAQQDEFALESTRRAIQAQKEGLFAAEIVPVQIPGKKPDEFTTVSEDEGPKNAKPDKIPGLKPVFKKDGTVTAANASSINDGAAALVLMSEEKAKAEGRTILGRIKGYAQAARKPVEFTIAPADAINTLLTKQNVTAKDVDLWEINEAFSVVAIANNRILGLDPAKVNVRGGAVVLGHPIGASGARVLVTLLQTMKDQDKKRGVASLCIGGGEGIALMVER
ncbi:thiolase family protein [Corallococcus exiguus]|uniref:thiolase family protein n=1 Tax=Corallococcus TaxID=83461 RepID=UPI000EC7BDAF|nr:MULTISPECIES: thiolase family protein [Corallococcus]NNB90612.1 thiolase family protein [Corallococcus exiguus]NNB94001.1 thiolase family protein [Corallococcus exiguus]NNC02746.1 thiolase family protein [Corallococcus exiguus]NPC51102.1 thiolase family protein [Corallococcus exiguus]NPC72994.1 thiolase family protein [Corallococcus exiguus]